MRVIHGQMAQRTKQESAILGAGGERLEKTLAKVADDIIPISSEECWKVSNNGDVERTQRVSS